MPPEAPESDRPLWLWLMPLDLWWASNRRGHGAAGSIFVKFVLHHSVREDSCFIVHDDLVVVEITMLLSVSIHGVVSVWCVALKLIQFPAALVVCI